MDRIYVGHLVGRKQHRNKRKKKSALPSEFLAVLSVSAVSQCSANTGFSEVLVHTVLEAGAIHCGGWKVGWIYCPHYSSFRLTTSGAQSWRPLL